MKIVLDLTDEAQQLLEDFVTCDETGRKGISDAMDYDYNAFNQRIEILRKAYMKAVK